MARKSTTSSAAPNDSSPRCSTRFQQLGAELLAREMPQPAAASSTAPAVIPCIMTLFAVATTTSTAAATSASHGIHVDDESALILLSARPAVTQPIHACTMDVNVEVNNLLAISAHMCLRTPQLCAWPTVQILNFAVTRMPSSRGEPCVGGRVTTALHPCQ